MNDAVHHPTHYGGEGPYEAIAIIAALGFGDGFCLGNVLKYVIRAGKKSAETEIEDLEKAREYLSRYIELKRKEQS